MKIIFNTTKSGTRVNKVISFSKNIIGFFVSKQFVPGPVKTLKVSEVRHDNALKSGAVRFSDSLKVSEARFDNALKVNAVRYVNQN